jgi:FMN-dependent oxidoreductase (nitrilotriacetate monooxygenase family)
MKFAVFMHGDSNYHIAGWRTKDSYPDGGMNFKRWIEFAQTMERGKLDMLFIADTLGVPGAKDLDALSRNSLVDKFDPMSTLAALSSVTEHIGLVATCATTYNEPYNVARTLASIDHLTGGRAGWNLVTGGIAADAKLFGHDEHVPHDQRYDRAEEFLDVCIGLWDSFEDDAFLRDKESGVYFDPSKIHPLNYKGKHFSVNGPLSVARPPQGRPVVIQAGSSEPAKRLSARVADVVFTAKSSLTDAQAFYADVKGRLAKWGRRPEDVKIMPGVAIVVGDTANEAEEKYAQLQEMVHPTVALSLLRERLGDIDLSIYPLDGPFPDLEGNSARMSTPVELTRIARRENLTLRQMALRMASTRSHLMIRGTVTQIVDQLEHWFVNHGSDGFNLLPLCMPSSLNDFVDRVVPELQRRGLFRTEYEGRTLRENLGVPRPPNSYVTRQTAHAETA